MSTIKTILVCLDLTYIDASVVEYAGYMAELMGSEKVYFLHVIQEYDLPDLGGREFPDEEKLYAFIYNQIKEEVDANFKKNIPFGIETRVEREDASTAIVDFISETKTGLVLIGQKYGAYREARYAHKIAAGADCDIMYVPERIETRIQKILCAIDCSKESEAAFQHALDLSDKTGAAIVSYFLYDTAQTYFPATTISSASMQQERSRKNYTKFLERFGLSPESIECHFKELDPTQNQADEVYKAAIDEKSDLIVVGAAGAIASATTLLGNIAENFNKMDKKIPLLIIKNKKTKRFPWI